MNVSMVLFGVASAAAAVVTGVATYAAIGDPPEPAGATAAGAAPADRKARVRLLPCEPGSRLEGRVCVKRVVRTVAAAAPPVTGIGVSEPAPAAAPVLPVGGRDDDHHGGDDHDDDGHHGGDDDDHDDDDDDDDDDDHDDDDHDDDHDDDGRDHD